MLAFPTLENALALIRYALKMPAYTLANLGVNYQSDSKLDDLCELQQPLQQKNMKTTLATVKKDVMFTLG